VNDLERAVGLVLRKYMSEISAHSVRQRAQRTIGVAEGGLEPDGLPRLRGALEAGIRLFVDSALQAQAIRELEGIEAEITRPTDETLQIVSESDVSRARLRAREVALALGASALAAQRAATVTSELCRNIVAYAGAGRLELLPDDGPPRELGIRAIDKGPGITGLDAILAGTYRSRTGLGKGLLGVKRIATRFDVSTGPRGTRVECSIAI
jgi:serine/threonine-protein kinase RsbT